MVIVRLMHPLNTIKYRHYFNPAYEAKLETATSFDGIDVGIIPHQS
ncbi:MAG: hypothetical protein H0A76_00015 [Candidatus Thiodubiliella endoseptemdiera]|uniref:Uncharacterized protein n=1 Tax=Candidatus Thiodubiliella endoseptemdiera TaxID=2738886 RepID=A0A853EYK4_9GAMM|nr:hypothetical protein [Candidatus Thiodubiliella endoseptemdiera]